MFEDFPYWSSAEGSASPIDQQARPICSSKWNPALRFCARIFGWFPSSPIIWVSGLDSSEAAEWKGSGFRFVRQEGGRSGCECGKLRVFWGLIGGCPDGFSEIRFSLEGSTNSLRADLQGEAAVFAIWGFSWEFPKTIKSWPWSKLIIISMALRFYRGIKIFPIKYER